MIYSARPGQVSYGEAIGILLLDASNPYIPGDVANATTYDFAVRFQRVPGYSVPRALGKDPSVYTDLLAAAQDLVGQGVRAVTGDCGFMALHQRRLVEHLKVPVFLSSLLQIPMILSMLPAKARLGVVTADANSLDPSLLEALGMAAFFPRLKIVGLQDQSHFKRGILAQVGVLDTRGVEQEVVVAAQQLTADSPDVGALLLECSCLPPYAAAIQAAVNLPVFDYVTLINYVHGAVVRNPFMGHM